MVKWNAHSRVLSIPVGVDHNHAHFMCLFLEIPKSGHEVQDSCQNNYALAYEVLSHKLLIFGYRFR